MDFNIGHNRQSATVVPVGVDQRQIDLFITHESVNYYRHSFPRIVAVTNFKLPHLTRRQKVFSTLHWLIHNLLVDFLLSQDELCSRNWTSPIVVFTRRVYKLAIKKTELPNTRPLRSPVANESNLTRLKGLSFSLCAPASCFRPGERHSLLAISARGHGMCGSVSRRARVREWVQSASHFLRRTKIELFLCEVPQVLQI